MNIALSSRRARWWRRRALPAAAAALCAGGLLAGMAPSSADTTLFSYDLAGGARGYSMFYDAPGQGRAGEFTVPEASTSLVTGGIGYGLASMAWPGPLVGNIGTLMAGLGAPPEARDLDWRIRAEARTPQDPPTTENRSVPGTLMRARATAEVVEALATVESTANEVFAAGTTEATSESRLDGARGVVESKVVVQNLVLGGGAVRIDSVTSTATAFTDGTTADGSGTTVVEGLTIGGMPATVGEDGISIGGQGVPVNAVINQIARQALSQAGMELVLSAPTREIDQQAATVDSGALTVIWDFGAEGGTFGLILGGARAAVTGSPGLDDVLDDFGAGSDTFGADGFGELGGFEGGGDAGTFDTGLGGTGGGETAVATGGDPTGRPLATQPAVSTAGKPIKPSLVLLALLGAGFAALAMRRLGDDVLDEHAAVAVCPLADG